MWNSVAVFCGSKKGNNSLFAKHAAQVGLILAQKNIQLIYGGGKNGLMGIVADAVLNNGGRVVGVIPSLLNEKEHQHEFLTTLHIVENMHERKKLMYELSDAAIILPGGYGTMDELFEITTWNQLSIHDKTIVLLNSGGYYNSLIAQLQQMQQEGFLYNPWNEGMIITDEPNELFSLMV
ncbi:MAG: TIGR00730 family Rossman fold protein [Parafilimonas sp.]|nr:TIGR00730 family Rossman fold protein [Parafilimonas sp.]